MIKVRSLTFFQKTQVQFCNEHLEQKTRKQNGVVHKIELLLLDVLTADMLKTEASTWASTPMPWNQATLANQEQGPEGLDKTQKDH